LSGEDNRRVREVWGVRSDRGCGSRGVRPDRTRARSPRSEPRRCRPATSRRTD